MSNIILRQEGAVQIVEINRPPHNYFDKELIDDIASAFEGADKDPAIRVTLICASGKSFCAGANFTGPQPVTQAEKREESRILYGHALRIFAVKKPVVAALHGHVIGGGLGLAVSADFRVCTPDARLTANFTRLGFHPGFGLTVTLPALLGAQKAAMLMLTGKRVTGTEAIALGLVDRLADESNLRNEAMALAQELAEAAPLALQSTRETLRMGLHDRVKSQLERELDEQTWLRETADFNEGIKATAERRTPDFKGH